MCVAACLCGHWLPCLRVIDDSFVRSVLAVFRCISVCVCVAAWLVAFFVCLFSILDGWVGMCLYSCGSLVSLVCSTFVYCYFYFCLVVSFVWLCDKFVSFGLFLCLCVCVCVCLYVCMSLSACVPVCLWGCVCVCAYVCVCVWELCYQGIAFTISVQCRGVWLLHPTTFNEAKPDQSCVPAFGLASGPPVALE